MRNRLMPVLRQKNIPRAHPELKAWASSLLEELQESLAFLVPLKAEEIDFISQIRENGKINPALITNDVLLIETLLLHPAIEWAAKKFNIN